MTKEFTSVQRELGQQPISRICYVTDERRNYLQAIEIPTTEDEAFTPQCGERVSAAFKKLEEEYPQHRGRMSQGLARDFSAFRNGHPELGQLTPKTKIFKLMEAQS